MSNAGKNLGVVCKDCQEPFAIPLQMEALNAPQFDGIPDPFPAKCPFCEEENLYQRQSIVVLLARRPR